tara:strand:+ start:920 stop:2071 length:1152 start_codon:yes stop_codon:yes gene_type:complete
MISKRKNNGKTVYCLDLRDSGYGRKFFKSKEAAQDYMDQQAKQLLGVREGRDKKTDWTFDQLLDVYIEHLGNVGKNAHNKTRSMHEIRGIKVDGTKLCTMRVRDFVVGDVESVVEAINKGRARKTVLEYMGHFRMLLDYAVRKGVISVNVFTQLPNGLVIDGGAEEKSFVKDTPISEDIIHAIADQLGGQWKVMYLFAAYTGLRSGELRALEWSDLDFDNGEIDVSKAVAYDREYVFVDGKRYERGAMIVKETKTAAGTRKVPMIDFIITMMREFKLASKHNGPRVFNSRSGHLIADSRFPEILLKACSQANVERIRWHDLRHYFASQLLKVYGNDWNRIKTYMGHTSIKTTIDVYGHWIENDAEKLANRNLLNDKLGKVAAR